MGLWVPGLTRGYRAAVAARLRELPPADRTRLRTRAKREARRDPRARLSIAVTLIAVLVWWGLLIARGAAPPARRYVIEGIVTAATVVTTLWCGVTHERLTFLYLAAQFPTLCPACGYDRRATPDRCPECGAESPVAPSAPADALANRG